MSDHRFTSAMLILLTACSSAGPARYPIVRRAPNCTGVGHVEWTAAIDETVCLDDDLQREAIDRALRRGSPWR